MSSNIAAAHVIRTARYLAVTGRPLHAAVAIDALLDCYPPTGDVARSVEFLLGGDTYDCLGNALEALSGNMDAEDVEALADDGLTPVACGIECLTEALELLVD